MLRLTTLGAMDLRDRLGHPVRDVLAQPKRVGLLVYLALESRKGPVPRERLLALFWPQSDPEHARNALSQALHHLRQALGADVVTSLGTTSVQVLEAVLWCDAAAFTEALERGDHELALDLYRGELCPGLLVPGATGLERWFQDLRARLRQQALAASRSLAERLAARGDAAGAARVARHALGMQPDDEADVRYLSSLVTHAADSGAARPAGAPARAGTRPYRFAAAAALSVLLAAVVLVWPRPASPTIASPDRAIAVFPFSVRGTADLGYLREGMVDLLSAQLEGTGGLQAIDPRSSIAAGSALSGERRAADGAARKLGAGRYITGEVIDVGTRIQLNAMLYRVGSLAPIGRATILGDTAGVFELVNGLAGQLLAGLIEGRDTVVTHLAAVSTHSLPALKAFLEGERALRAGLDARAAAAFREAATIDTSFALAQYRLAVSATWARTPDAENPTRWAAAAARNARRLTPLARDLLSAYRAYRQVEAKEAELAYRRITTSHPDNVEAWYMLGETLFHWNPYRGRSHLEAWAPFRRTLELDPTNAHAMLHLARLAAADGQSAALDTLARAYRAAHRDADRLFEMRALEAYLSDDSTVHQDIARAAAASGDEYQIVSVVHAAATYAENLPALRRLAPAAAAVRDTVVLLVARRVFSDLELAAGSWRGDTTRLPRGLIDRQWMLESQAVAAAEPSLPAAPARIRELRDALRSRDRWYALSAIGISPRALPLGGYLRDYLVGLLSVRLGDSATARRQLDQLEQAHDHPRATQQLAAALRAALARSRGELRQALSELRGFSYDSIGGERMVVAHWGVAERFAHAEILRGLRRDQEALALYESFNGIYDLPLVAAAHLRRAEIQLRLGNTDRARFHYGRVVGLWRDCDPEFRPLLEQARGALIRLAS